ncbi:1,4-alpha-glucan branching protein GlgB [Fibrobacter sp. UWB12]|uniref:1,4-alpha-glucan branching protein GlgB n=1 Tax=Fibrobacter sp. UWB12 TaxID=1896203 RepID=UPI00091D682F|nr:1,4-alpha-glucan branching protein GlgB [Fibrobacter sp. UWB12]SHK58882.1 1,4-alpha-glucan branching enzyme [Fibrobacter sp. UWB12]
MEWNDFTSLTAENMQAIWDFKTKDPFSILGIHPLETDRGIKTVIRTYQPQASFVRGESCDGTEEFDFVKLGDTGFFEAILDMEFEPFFYNLIIRQEDGNEYTLTDPYAFLPVLSDFDRHLIATGTHYELYRKLGANIIEHQGFKGIHFAVWAPNARAVSVVGNFNSWDGRRHQMRMLGSSGIWEIFIPNLGEGELYRFEIHGADGQLHVKVDPLAKLAEVRPATASITTHLDGYEWGDDLYMKTHWATKVFGSPMNIYEVHAGSWRRDPSNPDRFLNWDELSERLIPYLKEMGYTHVEFLPLAEHPLDESWGYQVTGYYSPTSRYGTPDQFRHFVDLCHQNEIGVILDWVPAHFPKDAHALGRFDGTACYEHADPRQGEHPHWGTYIFNLGRNEVKNFLIANAMYWLKEFHCDGLRVDAVASMLYLDYGKGPGEWVPNKDGGNINYDTLEFLKHLNSIMGRLTPHAILIAEESTSFPSITRPPEQGGLGFHYKWNMGWMNDFLSYIQHEPIHRKYHHNQLTFSMVYAYSENFIQVFSHDEVVHGKGSMLGKMPGDNWQKFANLRLTYAFQYAHPGKKLNFMGNEFGQFREWNEKRSLDWHLVSWDSHGKLLEMMKVLNHIYKENSPFWEIDHYYTGFEWIWCDDADNSIVSFVRKDDHGNMILCVFNFTPVVRNDYRLGAPARGAWKEIFNTDAAMFGGSNVGNLGKVWTQDIPWQSRDCSLNIKLPPLAAVYFKLEK